MVKIDALIIRLKHFCSRQACGKKLKWMRTRRKELQRRQLSWVMVEFAVVLAPIANFDFSPWAILIRQIHFCENNIESINPPVSVHYWFDNYTVRVLLSWTYGHESLLLRLTLSLCVMKRGRVVKVMIIIESTSGEKGFFLFTRVSGSQSDIVQVHNSSPAHADGLMVDERIKNRGNKLESRYLVKYEFCEWTKP